MTSRLIKEIKTLKSKRAGLGFYFNVVKLIVSEAREEREMSAEKHEYFYNLMAVIYISGRLKQTVKVQPE